jgi:hypothetical protein
VPGSLGGDDSALSFVFRKDLPREGATTEFLDALPARTTLERAIVSHLRAGGQWRSRTGWADLSAG